MTSGRTFKSWIALTALAPLVFAACADAGAYAEESEGESVAAESMAAANSVVPSLKGLNGVTRNFVVATAEMLSDEMYAFQPTDEVRTAGGVLAHIANSQYFFCSTAMGEDSPMTENLEETLTTKAATVEALNASYDYCDSVYDRLTDAQGAETVPFMGGQEMAKSGILAFNSAHNYEHYGNLVTYMRLNGITPPSSM